MSESDTVFMSPSRVTDKKFIQHLIASKSERISFGNPTGEYSDCLHYTSY